MQKAYGKWELAFQPRQRTVKNIVILNENIYIGTRDGIYISQDFGKSFTDFGSNQLKKDPEGLTKINQIYTDSKNNKIYTGTSYGAFVSDADSPQWTSIFESSRSESNNVNSLIVNNNEILLATDDGLWICTGNNPCQRLNTGIQPDNISGDYKTNFIALINDNYILLTAGGVYTLVKPGLYWENISDGIQKLPDGNINAKHIYRDDDFTLWLAAESGIYKSTDKGNTWEDFSWGIQTNSEGFQEAFYLIRINNTLFVCTASGIYSLDEREDEWINYSDGLKTKNGSKNIYWLEAVKSNNENFYFACTDEGLYKNLLGEEHSGKNIVLKGFIEKRFANLTELEPTVEEVQKETLKFASIPTSGDYKKYRLQARVRNFLPKIVFDINSWGQSSSFAELEKDISTNISLDNKFNAGRLNRLEKEGRNFQQLSAIWELRNFVYDNEVLDILNQARLTANIRENLLDDVTRIYFMRRKLQLEQLTSNNDEPETRLREKLALQELTGQLDSRTGGWFSREIAKRKRLYEKNI